MGFATPSEVAKILKVSVPTVRKLIASGDLQAVSVGKQKRIEIAQLHAYLRTHTTSSVSVDAGQEA